MDWNTWQAWVRAGYGRLDPISWEAANVTLLDLVRPEVHHKVHHHWHSFPPPHPLWHPILGTLYTIIGLLSLTGNGIVLWVFSLTRSLRSGTNLLTINLAFSDLLMMLTQFPILVANCFNQSWMLGPFACEVCGFCGALFGTVSIISLALIALDRYRAIMSPFGSTRLSMKRAAWWVCGVWVYSVAWCVLPFLGWNQYVLEGFLISCSFDYLSDDFWSRSYVVMLFLAAYALPLGVISYCYFYIMSSVKQHDKDILGHQRVQGEVQAVKYRNLHRREAQLSRVVLTSVFFWALAWTPYAVVSLLGVSSWYSLLTPMATALPALFAKLSTVYNPFIYAISHHKYRQELGRRLPWLCCILPSLSYQPSVSMQSSTRSDASSILHFFSRSSSVVSSRNEKAQSDLPSPKTLMSDMATMSFPKGFSRPMAL
uniref:G-protein coupled receptors family 1 profile domain-containing protein n=2 Tax=Scylla olivacea TaxID=85551 RepID=A0A0P4WEW1_SCYOL